MQKSQKVFRIIPTYWSSSVETRLVPWMNKYAGKRGHNRDWWIDRFQFEKHKNSGSWVRINYRDVRFKTLYLLQWGNDEDLKPFPFNQYSNLNSIFSTKNLMTLGLIENE